MHGQLFPSVYLEHYITILYLIMSVKLALCHDVSSCFGRVVICKSSFAHVKI